MSSCTSEITHDVFEERTTDETTQQTSVITVSENSAADTNLSLNYESNNPCMLTDNVFCDYNKDNEYPENCNIYSGTKLKVSESSVLNLFNKMPEINYSQYGENGTLVNFVNNSGETANLTPFSFSFFTDEGLYYEASADYFNGLDFGLEDELSFCSEEAAIDQIKNALYSIGVETDLEARKIYRITSERFSEFISSKVSAMDEETEKGKNIASKLKSIPVKDFYYIYFVPYLDEIPTLNNIGIGNIDTTNYISGNIVVGCYSEDGIESIYVSGIVNPSDKIKENVKIISIETLELCLKEKYEKLIVTNPLHITNIELIYAPIQNDNLSGINYTPVWKVDLYEDLGEIKNEKSLFFNAISGVEII